MKTIEKLIKRLRDSGDEEGLKLLLKAVSDEDLEGLSIVDDPDQDSEEDEAAKWLAGQEEKGKDTPKRVANKAWSPREDLTEDQKKAIQEHMEQGFSEREAHRFAGAHKEHSDHGKAMRSGLDPSMMSDKMIDLLKPLASEWMENADRHEKIHADIEKNPMKHASGQLTQAHEQHTADYNKAYHDLLSSDDVKNMKGMERHKHVQNWKKEYRAKNPEYDKGLTGVAEKQKVFGEAKEAAAKNLKEKMEHIMRGGVSMPGMSGTEAAQHLGQDARGDQPPSVGTADMTPSWAAKNPKLVNILSQEHMAEHQDRKNRIDSHAKAQGVIRRKKGEGQP